MIFEKAIQGASSGDYWAKDLKKQSKKVEIKAVVEATLGLISVKALNEKADAFDSTLKAARAFETS